MYETLHLLMTGLTNIQVEGAVAAYGHCTGNVLGDYVSHALDLCLSSLTFV